MARCFSFTATRDRCLRFSFSLSGLQSTTTDLGQGTVMHCWVPRRHRPSKPNLVLLHGIGANAMWQWNEFISPLMSRFNVYVPDLVFFGDSYTTRPNRSESFQAQCIAGLMKKLGVDTMNLVGMSYGGFVAYSMAAQFPDRIERLVLCCAGVCMEDKDMDEGMFKVGNIEDAISVLLPQTPDMVRQLIRMSFYKPPFKKVPSCFLEDFIEVMCTEYLQEKKELIQALQRDRKLSNLPKLDKPPLIIWGEYDQVFPVELAHRLKRHVGENAKLVVIKDAGHAINVEKSKEMFQHMKAFLTDPLPPSNPNSQTNGHKAG
ncbi:hypothetical protein SAY87_028791 [Trapa incisa]|uniref:AB hydrolase-1 domain-containing protein n=1 Tax=Trapa incisa TaxID=236973 RepID=A0AAN7KUP2_9MYRT|nr:hypothetical protein SAY87_028791 [Trapa incisa]